MPRIHIESTLSIIREAPALDDPSIREEMDCEIFIGGWIREIAGEPEVDSLWAWTINDEEVELSPAEYQEAEEELLRAWRESDDE